jgi:CrcB protein
MLYVSLILFGAVGVFIRYWAHIHYQTELFPWATLLVNVAGSFAIGFFYGKQLTGELWFSPAIHTGIMVGLLGALTTFSTFSLEAVRLMQNGQIAATGIHIFSNVFFSIGASFLGLKLFSLLFKL